MCTPHECTCNITTERSAEELPLAPWPFHLTSVCLLLVYEARDPTITQVPPALMDVHLTSNLFSLSSDLPYVPKASEQRVLLGLAPEVVLHVFQFLRELARQRYEYTRG